MAKRTATVSREAVLRFLSREERFERNQIAQTKVDRSYHLGRAHALANAIGFVQAWQPRKAKP